MGVRRACVMLAAHRGRLTMRVALSILGALSLCSTAVLAQEKAVVQTKSEVRVVEGHHVVLPIKGRIKRAAVANENTANVTLVSEQPTRPAPKARRNESR